MTEPKETNSKEKVAVPPEMLPEEIREVFEQTLQDPRSDEEKAIMDGQIPQDISSLQIPEEDNAVKWYRYFSQSDTYPIQMSDGKTITYTHIYPTSLQITELEFMRAQIGSGMDGDEKPLNLIRQHWLKELWFDKLANFYLLNTVTKKPMTHEERLNCSNDWHIKTVLKSCLWRSNNDIGPRGKNLDQIWKLQ